MPKVTYTSAKGLVQEAGSGVNFESMPFSPVRDLTGTQAGADIVISSPGIYKFNVDFVHSASLPLASEFPGGVFTFRSGFARAYALTGSAEAEGTKVFAGTPALASATNSAINGQGSKLALAAVAGSSVSLISDGVNYLVLGASGSYTISGT